MKVVIDRFEGDFAIVELPDGRFADLPKVLVPSSKEGDTISIEIEENNKPKENKERLHRLFNRNK